MRFVGIDPGLSGGIAYVDDNEHDAVAVRMPDTPKGVLRQLEQITEGGVRKCAAVLEHVHSTPQMGVASAFTFGKGYGGLLMALAACDIPFIEVAPLRWQNAMDVRTPKDRRAELGSKDKNISKRKAQQLFPDIKVTHAIADALLLAEYARRTQDLFTPF